MNTQDGWTGDDEDDGHGMMVRSCDMLALLRHDHCYNNFIP